MKIVILVSTLDEIGGTEVQSYNLAKRLAMRHEVVVLTRAYKNLPKREEKDGFVIKRFRYIDLPILRFFSHILSALIEVGRERKIDVLQCMMLSPNGLVGVTAKRLYNLKTAVWVRGGDWYIAKRRFVDRRIISYVLKNSSRVIVQTNKIKNELLREMRGLAIEVVPNGVELKTEVANGTNILFVGNLQERKGVKYLIEAVRLLENPPKLLIVGDGTERQKLYEQSKGIDVEFAGRIMPSEIKRYMRKGKIFVLPSLIGEGLPNVILEAMSFGIPVISTNISGIPDVVEHGKTGFLVEPGNPKELAKYMSVLLGNEQLRREMSKKCLEDVKKYSWEQVIDKLENVYARL